MEYVFKKVYWIKGATMPADRLTMQLFPDLEDGVSALLTSRIDSEASDVDEHIGLANLLLQSEFTGGIEVERMCSSLNSEVEKIRQERARQYGRATYLVITARGAVPDFAVDNLQECGSFSYTKKATMKGEIRQRHATQIQAALAAAAVSLGKVLGIKDVTNAVYYIDSSAKPLHTYSFVTSATGFTSEQISGDAAMGIRPSYKRLRASVALERVVRLLIMSLEASDDLLRSFQFAWTGLEIFVNKSFETYERAFYGELDPVDTSLVKRELLTRVKSVMRDKYRLADKFGIISYQLDRANADEDSALFSKLKKQRDDLAHGQLNFESNLDVAGVQKLVKKYLSLHIAR